MDYDEQDNEVVRLLSKLRDAESNYPVEMMTSRRHNFVKQIAALGLGTGAAFAMKEAAKAAGGSSIPPIAGAILETALIVAIVAEASFVAFVNREKVLDVFRTVTGQPTVVHVTTPADVLLPLLDPATFVETSFTETSVPTPEPTLMTETATAIRTPAPEILVVTDAASAAGATEPSGVQMNSTPAPHINNGNNGNHYGQTPAAERTKENEGGGGNSSDSNNDDGNEGNNGNNDNNGNNGRGH